MVTQNGTCSSVMDTVECLPIIRQVLWIHTLFCAPSTPIASFTPHNNLMRSVNRCLTVEKLWNWNHLNEQSSTGNKEYRLNLNRANSTFWMLECFINSWGNHFHLLQCGRLIEWGLVRVRISWKKIRVLYGCLDTFLQMEESRSNAQGRRMHLCNSYR